MHTANILMLSLYSVVCTAIFLYKRSEVKRCTLHVTGTITVDNGEVAYAVYDSKGKHVFTGNYYTPSILRPYRQILWINPEDPVEFVKHRYTHYTFLVKCILVLLFILFCK